MTLVATATILVAVVALWSLRHTWSIPWERPAAAAVALLAVDVVLAVHPVNRWVSVRLHAITGCWNIEDLVGHVCVIAALCSVLYLVLDRLDTYPSQFRALVRSRIELPATLAIAVMLAVFVAGDIDDHYLPDTIAAHTTPWLRAYWLTMSVACYFLLWNIAQALLILRRDPRSRRAACAYLVATGVSACCGLAFILEIEALQWIMVRAELVGYAIAASYTWRSKVADLRR